MTLLQSNNIIPFIIIFFCLLIFIGILRNKKAEKINNIMENFINNNNTEHFENIKHTLDKNFVKEYINGLTWIFNYYFNNKLNYNWYYPYEKAPFIEDIVEYLDTLSTIPTLEESYPLLLSPIEQAIYTSPIEITELLSKKYQNIAKKFYKKYNLTNILDKINKINCNNSNYLSKCSLLHINHPIYKLLPLEFIKEFRTESTSKEFIKLIKYYEITNDPFFYDILKKK